MKTRLLLLIIITAFACTTKAQYVTIPDANFVAWLNNNGFSQCMNGNEMDTTCSVIITAADVDCSYQNISSLEGIQYFKNLITLDCSSNSLNTIPKLASSVFSLACYDNYITMLPNLPTSLQFFDCFNNQLTSLPTLPSSLTYSVCNNNQLTSLPTLPSSLTHFECSGNSISALPGLPASLEYFACIDNNLSALPILPTSLTYIDCSGNQLSFLPYLPPSLIELWCTDNSLDTLPELPLTLAILGVRNNSLTRLPDLPSTLNYLECYNNQLITIPNLKKQSMQLFDCSGNVSLTCLPKLPATIGTLNFSNTAITCLPNYPSANSSTPLLSTLPLCDAIFNNSGCEVYWNITGKSFMDVNNNCIIDGSEAELSNIKYELWSNGTLIQQAYSLSNSYYSFDADAYGNYEIRIDTTNLPFTVLCPINGAYYDTITPTDSLFYSNDFSLGCKTGFDVGALSVSSNSVFRPANIGEVKINSGDVTSIYGAHCAAGVSGTVVVTINGPASYVGPAAGALAPTTVSGNTITWNVADFGTTNALMDFNIIVQTDTLAQAGQQVCFTVHITPTSGDNNPANNTFDYCFTVTNSFDPNEKEVYPAANIDTAQEWLTYTVHFQNTGNAEAQHIYVMDTLDANIDEATFQLLAYSHEPNVQINEKIVRFNFPNINLPDSTTDELNSHGYVQYKVKLKPNLPIGTQISNTAYIYFDFNSPVVTNTVTNTVAVDTSVTIGIHNIAKDNSFAVTVYPNPANQQLTIATTAEGSAIGIYNTQGQSVNSYVMHGTAQTFNIGTLPSGIYYVEVQNNGQVIRKKLVKL
jgi:uncharacterized repeat protein (TIGR01451 family)